MRPCGAVLNWFGSKAPALLLGSLVVGALLPSAAAMSEAALPIAAFLMMFGSLVAAGLAPYERPNGLLRLGLLILVVAIGPCLAAALAVKGVSLAADLALGVVLSVAGPPMASAAALAVILGLPPRLTLALSVVPTLLCPLTTPVLVRVFTGESVDAIALAVKLVAVVGSGSLAAVAVLAVLQRSGGNRANLSMAASGVSMIGLIGVGIAAASRARVEVEADLAGFGVLMVGALLLVCSWERSLRLFSPHLDPQLRARSALSGVFAIKASFGRLSARRCRLRRSGFWWRWSCPSLSCPHWFGPIRRRRGDERSHFNPLDPSPHTISSARVECKTKTPRSSLSGQLAHSQRPNHPTFDFTIDEAHLIQSAKGLSPPLQRWLGGEALRVAKTREIT